MVQEHHYLWVVLITRIHEVFPLLCPLCDGQTRLMRASCTVPTSAKY